MAQPHPSGAGLDKQQAKLRRVRFTRMLDQKHVAYVLAIHFRDPTPFPGRFEVSNEMGNDVSRQGFKRRVPSILLRIAEPLSINNPAHISDAMRAQNVRGTA